MVAAACPRCAGVVALHEGRPFVTTHGSVELWHRSCWEVRETPLPVRVDEPILAAVIAPARAPTTRSRRGLRAAIGASAFVGSAAVALVFVKQASARAEIAPSMVNVEVAAYEGMTLRARSTAMEVVPPRPERSEIGRAHV